MFSWEGLSPWEDLRSLRPNLDQGGEMQIFFKKDFEGTLDVFTFRARPTCFDKATPMHDVTVKLAHMSACHCE